MSVLAYVKRTTVRLPGELDLGATPGSRRLLAAAAGRSGRQDISERQRGDVLAAELPSPR